MQYLKKVRLCRIALPLLLAQSGQFADLAQINDYCTMDIKRCTQSSFSLAVPNGLVANLYSPVEGKRDDSCMLLIPMVTCYVSMVIPHTCTTHSYNALFKVQG